FTRPLAQDDRFPEVKGDQLRELIFPARRSRDQPIRRGGMTRSTLSARQGAVGAVADEDVPEHELAPDRGPEQLAVDEALDGWIEIIGERCIQRGDAISEEAATKDRSQ